MTAHTIHKCNNPHCAICRNNIQWCTKCGGIDESLTIECCKVPNTVTQHVGFSVIDKELDFMNGDWTGTEQALSKLENKLFSLGYTYPDGNNEDSQITDCTLSLSVDELGFIVIEEL